LAGAGRRRFVAAKFLYRMLPCYCYTRSGSNLCHEPFRISVSVTQRAWRTSSALLCESIATAFDNADYVDVVIHSYRHRLGSSPGFAPYHDSSGGRKPRILPRIGHNPPQEAPGDFAAAEWHLVA